MKKLKKIFSSTTTLISVLLIVLILFMLNFIASRNFKRLDLTQEKQYSISEATRDSLQELTDIVTINVYFSKKLPPNLQEVSQYVKDILDEYKAYAHGNLNVVFLDPADDPKLKNEVLSLGIPELQMNVLEKDKFEVQNGFLGIAIFYQDKEEVLPVVQDVLSLEYDLTSAIKKVSATEVKTVGFLTGHGEHLTYQGEKGDYTLLKKELEKNYEVETVLIEKGQPIEQIDTLIIPGPTEVFSERDLFEIDQFILQGGNVIVLLDGVKIEEGLMANPNLTGLEKLVDNYGVKVNQDLVIDQSSETVAFSSGFMQFVVPYPLWPKLIKDNFDLKNPIISTLDSLVLPWSSSLKINPKSNVTAEVLATTTPLGGTMKDPFNLDPNQNFQPQGARDKIDMVVLLSGKFNSYFADKPIPPVEFEQNSPSFNLAEGLNSQTSQAETTKLTISEQESKVLVVGDADFASDGQLQRFPQNAAFFLNMVDGLTQDSNLMQIRLRGITERTLKEVTEKEKLVIKIIGIALVPFLVVLFAIVKSLIRKKLKMR